MRLAPRALLGALLGALVLLAAAGCRQGGILEPEPGTAWLAVAAGGAHTCGIVEDGRVACWGSNGSGQLGSDPLVRRTTRPTFVSGVRTYQAVTAGDAHTCALDHEGAVWCWGSNEVGQLGDGTTLDRTTPGRALGDATGVIAISAGRRHTCAVLGDGRAICWGDNRKGQVGGGETSIFAPPTLVADGALRFAAISAGGEHTCGIAGSGEAHCWGANGSGQLGTGTTTSSAVPNRVAGGHLFRSLSAGGEHNCAVRLDESVLCWGDNGLGQTSASSSGILGTPYPAGWVERGRWAAAGQGPWSCADDAEAGPVCWGIRIGAGADGAVPAAEGSWDPASAFDPGEVRVSQLSAGLVHGCLLTQDGEIYCWGEGTEGQLGDGTRGQSLTLRRVGS